MPQGISRDPVLWELCGTPSCFLPVWGLVNQLIILSVALQRIYKSRRSEIGNGQFSTEVMIGSSLQVVLTFLIEIMNVSARSTFKFIQATMMKKLNYFVAIQIRFKRSKKLPCFLVFFRLWKIESQEPFASNDRVPKTFSVFYSNLRCSNVLGRQKRRERMNVLWDSVVAKQGEGVDIDR